MDSAYIADLMKRGSNSVVECQLPKLDVAGSTPVSRSIFFCCPDQTEKNWLPQVGLKPSVNDFRLSPVGSK